MPKLSVRIKVGRHEALDRPPSRNARPLVTVEGGGAASERRGEPRDRRAATVRYRRKRRSRQSCD